jgi:hypothetical protein
MCRKLPRIPVVVSLILLISVMTLIVRSWWTADLIFSHHVDSTAVYTVVGGEFGLYTLPHGPEAHDYWWHESRGRADFVADPLWFHAGDNPYYRSMPLWLLTIPPVSAAIYFARGRHAGSGFCASCGYDLRASPERCPECGRDAQRA